MDETVRTPVDAMEHYDACQLPTACRLLSHSSSTVDI
jgi:hypothetical protein